MERGNKRTEGGIKKKKKEGQDGRKRTRGAKWGQGDIIVIIHEEEMRNYVSDTKKESEKSGYILERERERKKSELSLWKHRQKMFLQGNI